MAEISSHMLLIEKRFSYAKKSVSLEKILINLFFMTILFPYITFWLPTSSDSQPWAVLVGSFLLAINMIKKQNLRFHKITLTIVFLSLICIFNVTTFFVFGGGELVSYLRTIFKYVSFLIIIPVVVIYFEKFHPNLLSFSILLWFMLVVAQILTKRALVAFMLPRVSFSYGRNFAIGFAPEPAYMAKVCAFFLLLIDYHRNLGNIKPVKAVTLNLLVLIMILTSASLTGLVLMSIYLLTKFFISLKNPYHRLAKILMLLLLSALIISSMLFYPLIINFFADHASKLGRAGYYINKMIENGSLFVLLADASFESRFGDLIRIYDSFTSGNIFGLGVLDAPIGSIFSPVYDSGIFGLLFTAVILFSFVLSLFRVKNKGLRSYLLELFIMFILLTFSESLATSYIAFIAGIPLFLTIKARPFKK